MHIKRIHEMIEKLTECTKSALEENKSFVGDYPIGDVVDMIKDLCEAEKEARVAKQMEECEKEEEEEEKYMLRMLKDEHKEEYKRMREEYGEDEGERRFYDNYRWSNGRFAPKGRGSYEPRRSGRRRGYEETPYMHMYPEMYGGMTPEEMRDMDLDMNRMYYSSSYSSNSGGSSSGGGRGSSGGMSGGSSNMGGGNVRGYSEGYNDGYSEGERSGRSGRSNSRYDNARRGYEESKQMHGNNTKEDNDENLKNLEKVLAVIDEDVKELMPNMTPSEKTMLKAKFSTWAQKVS